MGFVPATPWDMAGTGDVHRAESECPYPSLHRSYTAGKCFQSHSTSRIAPTDGWLVKAEQIINKVLSLKNEDSLLNTCKHVH